MTSSTFRRAGLAAAILVGAAVATTLVARADAPAGQGLRFKHAEHVEHMKRKGMDIAQCGQCHTLDPKTHLALHPLEGLAKENGHKPCALSGCHVDEFFQQKAARKLDICSSCHVDPQPWEKPKMVDYSKQVEFGRDLSHADHDVARNKSMAGSEKQLCQMCHPHPDARPLVLGGHDVCAKCHGQNASSMDKCENCHKLGTMATGAPHTADFKWYVTANFKHEDSGTDHPKADCTSCHTEIAKATHASEITRPKMETCDRCHDGKAAFKTTGFACARCHKKP